MVAETQGSDRIKSPPAGDATSDSAMKLSQSTWDQMDTSSLSKPANAGEPSNLVFDDIYSRASTDSTFKLGTDLKFGGQGTEALDSGQLGAIDGDRTNGAIDTETLMKLDQQGIQTTEKIAVSDQTTDRDRYRSLDVLLKNDVNEFTVDSNLYRIKSTESDTLHLMKDMPDAAPDQEMWKGDKSVLDTNPTTRSLKPTDYKLDPGQPITKDGQPVTKDGQPVTKDGQPET